MRAFYIKFVDENKHHSKTIYKNTKKKQKDMRA